MERNVLVIGLGIGLVVASVLAGASFFEYQNIKTEYNELKEEMKSINQSAINWKNKYYNLQNQYNTLQKQYNTLQNNYSSLQSQYNNIQNEYNNYKEMVNMRTPTGNEKCKFITPDDDSVKTRAASILGGGFDGSLSTGDIDKINDWVYDHIDYNHDVYVGEKGKIGKECWQYPSETLNLGYGDCEDQALLVISMCLAEEKVGWLYCAEVEFTKGSEKINHVCIFINVQDDKMAIVDPTLKNDDWLNPGGWISTEARYEPSALDDYRKAMGADSIRVKSVFNMNIYKSFSNNEAFYNWF